MDDQFGGLTKEAQNQLAVKLIMTEKEKVSLKVQANKAKEMTKAALQELLLAREELREAHEKRRRVRTERRKAPPPPPPPRMPRQGENKDRDGGKDGNVGNY